MLERTTHVVPKDVKVGKVDTIRINCPHCNTSQTLVSKSREIVCSKCKKKYVIPKEVLELI